MMKFPRKLSEGKGVRGVEFYGCCNSGHAVVLLKSKLLKQYTTQYRFMVGREGYIQEHILMACRGAISGQNKRVIADSKNKHNKSFLYRSYRLAKAKFTELNDITVKDNLEVRQGIVEANNKIKAGLPLNSVEMNVVMDNA